MLSSVALKGPPVSCATCRASLNSTLPDFSVPSQSPAMLACALARPAVDSRRETERITALIRPILANRVPDCQITQSLDLLSGSDDQDVRRAVGRLLDVDAAAHQGRARRGPQHARVDRLYLVGGVGLQIRRLDVDRRDTGVRLHGAQNELIVLGGALLEHVPRRTVFRR